MEYQQLVNLISKLDLPAERVQSLREDMGGGTADWNRMGSMWGLWAALPLRLGVAYMVQSPVDRLADLAVSLISQLFDLLGKQVGATG